LESVARHLIYSVHSSLHPFVVQSLELNIEGRTVVITQASIVG